jgi:ParB family chromosome partitioning protein
MAKRSVPEMTLPSVDDLFTTQEHRDDIKREKILDIPLSEVDEFPDHPFKVRLDDELRNMVESIKQYGVLTPALVRVNEVGRYELVSGHRRKKASELAGIETLPVIAREMTRDEAVIAMVDANLQREVILPSEKAYSYKMKLEAISRQGQRSDLTCSPLGNKLQGRKSLDVIGEDAGDSRNTVHRYIRLTELIPEIITMVDEGSMALRPAVEISYLSKEEQQSLLGAMELEVCTPSHAQTLKMRKFADDGRLDANVILSILSESKPNQVEQLKIPRERINKYFSSDATPKAIEETIIKALELYRRKERKMDAR